MTTCIYYPSYRRRPRVAPVGVLTLLAGLLLSGCSAVRPEQQRLVSKPNMTFSDSTVFGYQHKLLPQVEPGSATSGGATAGGCTSCR